VTLRDSYALPHIADILGVLQGKSYFSTMDCAQGFYQILVDRRDRHKTAFSTPLGNYQFVRCPFGARNSCAVFQSEMNRIFRDGLYTRCVIYVDDILVFGSTRQEHDENLEWVLSRCKEYNVKLKLEKCYFAKREVDYLGFKITGQTISPLKERTESLKKDKPPRSKTELRSVIGKLNFYSRFIPNYSKLLEPLRELFAKNRDFQWRQDHQKTYESLLEALDGAEPQRLTPRREPKIVELHIMKDSLEVLCLTLDEQLICRASRFLGPTEANYSCVEKQLLALTLAISKFRTWLEPERFVVRVPSNGITKALELADRPERVERLLLRLPEGFDVFRFEVKPSLTTEISSKFLTHIPQEVYYVDGACKGNGKADCVASWAVVAEYDQDLEESGFVKDSPSNQSAELTAAIRACEIARDRGQTEITIVTDSKYLHSAATNWIDKWLTNEWKDHRKKPVMHAELFKQLLKAKESIKIEWIHVRGHTDVPGNLRADHLARSLLDRQSEALKVFAARKHPVQIDDPEIEQIKREIRDGKRNDLFVENESVFYVDPRMDGGYSKRLYVPQLSRRWLLELAHDNQVYGGHLGIKKTISKLTRFWWPGMSRDIEQYVKSCEICQAFKERPGLPPGLLHSIPISRVFEHVHLDIVGPTISSTVRGNRYIITATDAFSKYAFAKPCQSVKTHDLVKFVEEAIISMHGKPELIITDRGTQFTSSEWDRSMKEMKLEHQLTSSYHPQSNGIDERLNGTLVRILKAYVNEFQEDWDEKLKWALYVYNTTNHSSTGFSPYHILHGLEPRSPFNEHLSVESDHNTIGQIRQIIRQTALEYNKRAQEAQKREYDKRRTSIELQPGQLVWVREHACPTDLSRKFYPKWSGPCVIVKVIGERSNPRAAVVLDCKYLVKKTVAIQDLKMHQQRPDHLCKPPDKNEKGETQPGVCVEDLNSNYYFVNEEFDTAGQDTTDRLTELYSQEVDDTMEPSRGDESQEMIADVSRSARRVTFGDVTINQSADDTLEDADDSASVYESPTKNSPYLMDFIIDNPSEDPTFDPGDSTRSSNNSVDCTVLDDSDGNLSVENAAEAEQPQSRYNLRPRQPRLMLDKSNEHRHRL
jgi:ribonuclease HI